MSTQSSFRLIWKISDPSQAGEHISAGIFFERLHPGALGICNSPGARPSRDLGPCPGVRINAGHRAADPAAALDSRHLVPCWQARPPCGSHLLEAQLCKTASICHHSDSGLGIQQPCSMRASEQTQKIEYKRCHHETPPAAQSTRSTGTRKLVCAVSVCWVYAWHVLWKDSRAFAVSAFQVSVWF